MSTDIITTTFQPFGYSRENLSIWKPLELALTNFVISGAFGFHSGNVMWWLVDLDRILPGSSVWAYDNEIRSPLIAPLATSSSKYRASTLPPCRRATLVQVLMDFLSKYYVLSRGVYTCWCIYWGKSNLERYWNVSCVRVIGSSSKFWDRYFASEFSKGYAISLGTPWRLFIRPKIWAGTKRAGSFR